MLTNSSEMPWGKHKGEELGDIDNGYFKFIRPQEWMADERHDDLRMWIDEAFPDFKNGTPASSSSGSSGSSGSRSGSGSKCRDCGEDIIWIEVNGRNTPIDAEPVDHDGVNAHLSHFATCKKDKPRDLDTAGSVTSGAPEHTSAPDGVDLTGDGNIDDSDVPF